MVASNGESSPAYRAIEHLLCKEYRVDSADDLRVVAENSTRCVNMLCCWLRGCGRLSGMGRCVGSEVY